MQSSENRSINKCQEFAAASDFLIEPIIDINHSIIDN